MSNYETRTVPARDLDAGQVRALIDDIVTVSVYEDAEASKPAAVMTGRLALFGKNLDGVLAVQLLDSEPLALEADTPVTITWEARIGG
jgi:hypothetical protein